MFLNYKFGKKGAQNNIFLNSVSGGVRWGIIQHFAYHTWNKKIVGVPLVIAYCSPVTITEYFHSSFTFPHSVCQSYHLILEILHLNVSRAVIKRRGLGISPGYYERGPRLLL